MAANNNNNVNYDDPNYSWKYYSDDYGNSYAQRDNKDGTATTYLTNGSGLGSHQLTDEMEYAIKSTGGDPYAYRAADDYISNLFGRIGTASANTGEVLTAEDIQKELTRLGYNTSADGNWTTVDGRAYLTSGAHYDTANAYAKKAGLNNVHDMADFMPMYSYANVPIGENGLFSGGEEASIIGNDYNYLDDYNSAYAQRVQEQLEQIEKNRDEEQRQAYIAMKQGLRGLREANAASGLADSGYAESSYIDLLNNYGSNVNSINNQYSNLYADTAMNGAWNLEQLRQQEIQNQIAQQQYADRMAQQQWENQMAERQYQNQIAQQEYQNQMAQQQYADQMAQQQWENNYQANQQYLVNLKNKADAALAQGLWTPDVQSYYGLTQEQFYGTTPTTRVQNADDANASARARANYANEIKTIAQTYNISTAEAQMIRDTAVSTNTSIEDAAKVYFTYNGQ